jgi:hypothetical protein
MIFAYFDPGSGSLLVQAIVGGLAGLVVFARYLWNAFTDRFLHFDRRTIGADVNALTAGSSAELPIIRH